MINYHVQKLMMLAFSVWHPDKAEYFAKHMDPFLHEPKFKKWQVIHWAAKFPKSMYYEMYLQEKYIITDEITETIQQEE